MAVIKLTEARIRELEPGSGIWRDEQVKGLMVICHATTKTYAVQGDVCRNGRHVWTVRVKIDRVDQIGLREARTKAKAIMSQIQSGVEPVLSFEPKGRPIVSGPNMLHVVIASNEAWVVPAMADERRFAVFEADTEARKALPPSFFIDLSAEMENGGLSAMLHDLLTIDLAGWHPRSAIPNTKALVDQKVEGFKRDPPPYWWFRLLESGSVMNRAGFTGGCLV